MDGSKLVAAILGGKGKAIDDLGESECQAYRDLFLGMFCIFRNEHAHKNKNTPWHEADEVVAMINCLFQRIDDM